LATFVAVLATGLAVFFATFLAAFFVATVILLKRFCGRL
jgi:hypothetical protein